MSAVIKICPYESHSHWPYCAAYGSAHEDSNVVFMLVLSYYLAAVESRFLRQLPMVPNIQAHKHEIRYCQRR